MPVPIPVPVPYPVPVPAALWTGDFVAAASSMISRDGHAEPGTLRLRGDPAAPWFAWHPRFNQPLHGARLDPRLTGVFDPSTCTFQPDQVMPPRLYGPITENTTVYESSQQQRSTFSNVQSNGQDVRDDVKVALNAEEPLKEENPSAKDTSEPITYPTAKSKERRPQEIIDPEAACKKDDEDAEKVEESEVEAACGDSLSSSFDKNTQRMYEHSREDSGSSSGRSSADSSDLEEDSSSHRFSRVFVVNDDSLTSDNDIEDNEEDDSDSAAEGGVTLKRVTAIPEEEPVVLQHVRLLNEDALVENERKEHSRRDPEVRSKSCSKICNVADEPEDDAKLSNDHLANSSDKRRSRGRRDGVDDGDKRLPLLLQHRSIPEEMYLADDNDCSGNRIELRSIRTLDPDSIDPPVASATKTDETPATKIQTPCEEKPSDTLNNYRSKTPEVRQDDFAEPKSSSSDAWDSTIVPDSLEISGESVVEDNDVTDDQSSVSSASCAVSDNEQRKSTTNGNDDDRERRANQPRLPVTDRNVLVDASVDSSIGNESDTTDNKQRQVFSVSPYMFDRAKVRPSHNFYKFAAFNSKLVHRERQDSAKRVLEDIRIQLPSSYHLHEFNGNDKKSFTRTIMKRSAQPGKMVSEWSADEDSNDADIARNVASMISRKDDDDEDDDGSVTRRRAGRTEEQDGAKDNDPSTTMTTAGDLVGVVDVGDAVSSEIQETSRSAEGASKVDSAHDGGPVRGEITTAAADGQVGGSGSDGNNGDSGGGEGGGGGGDGESLAEGGTTRFRSVERRPCTRKENGFPADASAKDLARDAQHFLSAACNNNNNNNSNSSGNSNKYRSLVMITQEASYQPVSVVTSDTTTLLQPDEIHSAGQGLAGYFQLALEAAGEQSPRKNGQAPRRPLMVKRLPAATATASHQSEPEVDSGLSVGSASESDDVSVKNNTNNSSRLNYRAESTEDTSKERATSDNRDGARPRVSSQSSDDNSANCGVIILEEGLADDDSWVEEVSHDEDEPGATTATEESSEDEANNFGDREEELRGYRRQAIDFTLHTIVEESCEESETEPGSLATGSPSKKPRPPSASELEKYFFFGLGGDGNSSSMGSREVDSLSETSSIYSEGLESLGQDETNGSQNQDRSNSGDSFLNSSRLEKYYLSEFLGFDQDRRDSDGSVGSDSEGRPSPEAQRRKKLVRARGTGRSHSSSLDNLLALTQSSQNLSSQNSLQDLSLNQDAQETQSEGSSTETDGTEDGQTAAFGTDGQFDTVKRKKKKPRNLGTQSPRVPDDRNKTPEPNREMTLMSEVVVENENEAMNSEDSDRAKTPQPESVLSSSSSPSTLTNTSNASSSQMDTSRNAQVTSADVQVNYSQRSKQQSRDSGFVGSCDDLLQHQKLPDESNQPNSPEADHEASGAERVLNKINDNVPGANPSIVEEIAVADKNNLAKHPVNHAASLPHLANASLSRKDSFNNWSSDEETNLMMSKMRQFFKTMVANSNGQNASATNSSGVSPAPSPRLTNYTSKARLCTQNRTKPPQLVYFENELTRLMKTVPGIRDEQVREIVEYLSSEDTWSDSYDSSDYTSSDLEGAAAGGRRSALQEQISQSCQQIISKFDTTSGDGGNAFLDKERDQMKNVSGSSAMPQPPCFGRDTAFVYQKLVQSFTKMAGDGVSSDANSTPHSSPPLIAKVMHHIGSRLVALMHEVSEGGPAAQHHSSTSWRRYSQHHRTPSSASTTEDDDSTSDSTNAPSSTHLQLPRSKSHDPLLLINSHPAASACQEGEEREASDYERFSWRGSFESALMAADSRTKLSLLACSGDVSGSASASASALAMAAKRRSAGDLLFNPKSFSREQLDRVRSCGSIGGGSGGGGGGGTGGGSGGCSDGSIEERIWSNRRRSSVPDANTRGESGERDSWLWPREGFSTRSDCITSRKRR